MVVEIATIYVNPDDEAAFVDGFAAGAEILRRQPGCQGMRWGKRVEPELAYMIAVEWDRIEDHFAFRETEDYKSFGSMFRDYLTKPPEVFHFEPRG
jgi:heme-degrading monooxygenase HmoA